MATLETFYVVDTHALFWRLTIDSKLSRRADEIFDAAERGETLLIIPAIVLAELYHLNQKLKTPLDFAVIFKRLAESPAFEMVPFHPADVLDFAANAAITELHDRMIAGLARRLDAPLITLDPIITASRVAKVEW